MPRLNAIDPKEATGKAKELLDGVKAKIGMVPNLMRTFANSPAALEGYLNFTGIGVGHCQGDLFAQFSVEQSAAKRR